MLFLLIFIVVFELSLHARMPLLGHDNPIWMDQLIVGKWHFVHQGLAIQRYSPHICGGSPVYGNPESLQYSLAQFLTYVMHPWWAMQISVVVALVVGYFGWFQFGKKAMGLKDAWSQLLALVMVANGFIFIHLAIGHFQMHTMPLIGCFLFLLFDRSTDSPLRLLFRGSLFGLISLYTLIGAGYNVLLFTALVVAFYLPFDLIFSADLKARALEVSKRIIASGTFSLLLMLSKLVAVLSFMKYFPRVEGYGHFWKTANIFDFIARSFWLILPSRETIPGYGWDLHEKTIFMSPVTWIGLIAGLYLLFKQKEWIRKNLKKSALLFGWAIFTSAFLIQLSAGNGFLVDQFLTLPVVRSLRVASRFLYIYSIFVSILSVYALASFSNLLNEKWKPWLPKTGMVLTILSLGTGWYAVRYKLALAESYTIRTHQLQWLKEHSFESSVVTDVRDGNTDFFSAGNKCHVELLKNNIPIPLLIGETKLHYNGAYNLINPACYQYPDENDCKPGDRIKVEDQENFENFTNGRPVTWKLSTLQHLADYTSLVALGLALGIIVSYFRKKKSV